MGKGVKQMQRVLIADAAGGWREQLEQALSRQYLLRSCQDGQMALELVEQFRPDVLILDLMLSGIDGLGVLKHLDRCPERPRIIVTGRYFSDFTNMVLDQYQVDSMMLKPCAVQTILDRVAELLGQQMMLIPMSQEPADYISTLLVRLNVRTSQQGFRFLRSAILRMMEDPTQQLTKVLYPDIAREFGTTDSNVEKALRTAVTCAWQNRRDEVWRYFFPPAPNGQIPKPTAGQFIRRLADVVASVCRKHA